ncbi:MAG: hypothetical protein HQL43_09890 [Alphaproteobacteria bacterium]|nr:hypothetical protein [Alphaproteobacteria bacterium]
MGGFNSVAEGMPSGNNVPLGNSTDDSGNGFAGLTPAAPPASTGGDWASQVFAPSGSMSRQMPEQTWRPSQTALDQIVPPKPSPDHGSGPLTVRSNDERKINPYIMNLAGEHPENPVPKGGGLLGTPVNSNLVADDKHRIDGKKRLMHDDWARIINKAPDFNGILPTFKYHVENNGMLAAPTLPTCCGGPRKPIPPRRNRFSANWQGRWAARRFRCAAPCWLARKRLNRTPIAEAFLRKHPTTSSRCANPIGRAWKPTKPSLRRSSRPCRRRQE